MSDLTVVYYTSNRENKRFEWAIQNALLKVIDGLRLISVSQKPIKFGYNICVGDVGSSEINIERQLLIGAEAAKTKYICTAESDFLYPPEYFKFRPTTNDRLYLANPVYILFAQRGKKTLFAPKRHGCEGAMLADRELIVEKQKELLRGFPEWHDKKQGEVRTIGEKLEFYKWSTFYCTNGIVTFKTDNQLHRRTPSMLDRRTVEIPYWGEAHELRKKYG